MWSNESEQVYSWFRHIIGSAALLSPVTTRHSVQSFKSAPSSPLAFTVHRKRKSAGDSEEYEPIDDNNEW